MGALETRTAGSRLAIILTTVIVTTVVIAGGVAVATVGINSVGSAEIKDESIRSVDIRDNQVKTSDIGFGQVTTSDIGTGEVRSVDIATGQVRSVDIGTGQVTGVDIANGTIRSADLAAAAQPAGLNFDDGNQDLDLTSEAQSVRSVVLDAPAAGHVMVTASGWVHFGSAATRNLIQCSITDGAIAIHSSYLIRVSDSGVDEAFDDRALSGTRTFAVPAGPTTFRLVCEGGGSIVNFRDSQITALYVPALYAP